MKLILSPQRNDAEITYSVSGTDFVINGTAIDLSGDWVKLEPDTEGEPLEPSGNLLEGVRDTTTGEITLTVRAPYKANASESELFPSPIVLADGESIAFPRVNNEED